MLKKGVSHVMWFILAFILVLVLIAVGVLILKQGEDYAMKGIDDLIETVRGIVS